MQKKLVFFFINISKTKLFSSPNSPITPQLIIKVFIVIKRLSEFPPELNCSTIESKTAKLSLDRFFGFLMEESYYGKVGRARLEELQEDKGFFKLLESMTFTELQNPKILDKNNINNVTRLVNRIEDLHQYNPNITFTDKYFHDTITDFKHEIKEVRETLGE